jgi:hypothetical protein
VVTPHRPSVVLLGALVNVWRDRESAPPCAWLLVVPGSIPLGHAKTSSVRWAHRSADSAHTVQAACLPDSLANMLRAHPVSLVVAAKLGRRN